eukprot:scaffold263382_cov32-Tisochrysis_lutea.AAC.1
MRYESLLTPTKSAGFSFSGSTSPGTGRKIVWRVEVFNTQHLPLRWASRSTFAPSYKQTRYLLKSSGGSPVCARRAGGHQPL